MIRKFSQVLVLVIFYNILILNKLYAEDKDVVMSSTGVYSLSDYSQRLYVGTSSGEIYCWDPSSHTISSLLYKAKSARSIVHLNADSKYFVFNFKNSPLIEEFSVESKQDNSYSDGDDTAVSSINAIGDSMLVLHSDGQLYLFNDDEHTYKLITTDLALSSGENILSVSSVSKCTFAIVTNKNFDLYTMNSDKSITNVQQNPSSDLSSKHTMLYSSAFGDSVVAQYITSKNPIDLSMAYINYGQTEKVSYNSYTLSLNFIPTAFDFEVDYNYVYIGGKNNNVCVYSPLNTSKLIQLTVDKNDSAIVAFVRMPRFLYVLNSDGDVYSIDLPNNPLSVKNLQFNIITGYSKFIKHS